MTEEVAKAPFSKASESTAMSSVSLRFSRFEVRACTEAIGPRTSQSMSWMWMAWVVRQPPSSPSKVPRQLAAA